MDSSVFDVYQPAIDSDVESQINAYRRKAESSFNEWLLLSGIRRPAPLDERDFTLETALKEIKEQDVTHLVVEERTQFRQLDEVKQEKGD